MDKPWKFEGYPVVGHATQMCFTSNVSEHVNRIVVFTNEKTVKHDILVTTMKPTLNELAIDVRFFRQLQAISDNDIWTYLKSGRNFLDECHL